MIVLLIVLFFCGVALGLVVLDAGKQSPRRLNKPSARHDSLDDVDNMVLWGEVSGDEFYKM